MSKVIRGLSSIEREQVDRLNKLNRTGAGSISGEFWEGVSICALVGHLVECADKEEVQACLDMIEVE